MANEFPPNDPRNIWQQQSTEPVKMSANQIRMRAQRHEFNARMEALITIVTGILMSFAFARTFTRTADATSRLGWGILSIWGIYAAVQAYRWIWPRKLPPDTTPAGPSLAFYRSELERRRDYGLHVWRRSGLPVCFLGMALVVAPGLAAALHAPGRLWNAAPFAILLALWIAFFVPMRRRKQQLLDDEIDELNQLEREGR